MAELINNKYPIKIEILTPLSVGAGEENNWKQNIDYIIKAGKLYHLSLTKMIESGIDVNKIANYFSKPSPESLRNLVSENQIEQYSDIVLNCPVAYSNDYKSFIKNDFTGEPYIPGSSIKGAIRSALTHHLLVDKDITEELRKKNQNKYDISDKYFCKIEKNEDTKIRLTHKYMQLIKVGDFNFEDFKLVNTKVFNLYNNNQFWEGGWKEGKNTQRYYNPLKFNTIYECLIPKQISFGSIMIGKLEKFNHFISSNDIGYNLKKNILKDNGINKLFELINQTTLDYLYSERKFFSRYNQAQSTEKIINCIDSLINSIPKDNSSCIIKMAAGTGFHSITGNWQYEDFTNTGINKGKVKYKSRKIASWNDELYLMGFIRISIASETELKEFEKQKEELVNKQRALEEETQRFLKLKEEEELRKKAEEEKRIAEIELLKTSAMHHYNNANWKEALNTYQNLSNLDNHSTTYKDIITELEYKLKEIEYENISQKNKELEEKERKAANAIPFIDKIRNVGKIPTLAGNIKQWMKQNDVSKLSNEDLNILKERILSLYDGMKPREQKQFNLNAMNDILGKEIADTWLKEIKI